MKTYNKPISDDLLSTAHDVNFYERELAQKINRYEADKLIKDAIKESEKRVDTAIRRSERELRREMITNNTAIRKSLINLVLVIIFAIVIYLCAGSYDQGIETTATTISLLIAIIVGGFSFANLLYYIYKLEYNEKYKYIVCFTDHSDAIHNYQRTYITRATNPKKAVKRFYKLYNYEEIGNVYLVDDYGNKYDDHGHLIEDK